MSVSGTRKLNVPYQKKRSTVSKNVKTYVKRQINANEEPKQYITASTGTMDYDVSPIQVDITPLVLGDKNYEREGNQVKPQSLEIMCHVKGTDALSCNRLMVIQWKKDTAVSTPNLIVGSSNVLNSTAGAGLEFNSPFDLDFKQHYNVLFDRKFICEKNTLDGSEKIYTIKISGKRMRNIYFNSDTVTTGKNHIYLLGIGNQTSASADSASLYYTVNLIFKE